METAVSVLSREGGCIPGHGGWVTLLPGHRGNMCIYITLRPSPPVLSLPVTEGQVVGGATPGTGCVRCKYILGITGNIDPTHIIIVMKYTLIANNKHLLNATQRQKQR